MRWRKNRRQRWGVTDGEDLPFSSHLCLTLTLRVLKMQTRREGCHYKDYHYIFRRAGQMFSAGNPLQCTIFVWGHQEGCFFVVIQGNVHIALGKKVPPSLQKTNKQQKQMKKKTWHHFFSLYKAFSFLCWFPLLLLFISYFIPVYPYICICRFVVLVSFCCLTEGYLRSFNERPFTGAGSKPTGRLAKVMSQDMM